MFSFVVDHYFGNAVNFSVNISTSDIAQNPEFSVIDRQSSEVRNFLKSHCLVDLAYSFEVKEVKSFNDSFLEGSQKNIFFDCSFAFFNFGSSSIKVKVNF